jgi:hypothetical protein
MILFQVLSPFSKSSFVVFVFLCELRAKTGDTYPETTIKIPKNAQEIKKLSKIFFVFLVPLINFRGIISAFVPYEYHKMLIFPKRIHK